MARVVERPLPAGRQGPRHFPNEQAALKCLCLVTRSLDPTGTGRTRWTMRWTPALNAFAITISDRFPAAENLLTKIAGNTVSETALFLKPEQT